MITAIVYTSNTGHTKTYGGLLAQKTGLPALTVKEAEQTLSAQAEVLFMGWLMAGTIKGYKEAARRFTVRAVCAVGMVYVEDQRADLIKSNAIPEGTPLFCLDGGFEMDKLHGLYRFMMKCMRAVVGKQLRAKTERTPQEEETLALMENGKNCVSEAQLETVKEWFNEQRN